MQSCTEKDNEKYVPRFIFRVGKGGWFGGLVPGKPAGVLVNDARTENLPLSGWKVYDDYKDERFKFDPKRWDHDHNLEIVKTSLVTKCDNIMIEAKGEAAAKYPNSLGKFKKCDKMWNGRPVFINKHGKYLNTAGSRGWSVSDSFGRYSIAGLADPLLVNCPGTASKWIYWDRSRPQPANISIFCPVHYNKQELNL